MKKNEHWALPHTMQENSFEMDYRPELEGLNQETCRGECLCDLRVGKVF